ncbi:hypothetical protein IEO70_06410 [Bacillus sp. AGMB 02131]|uniref:Uncharacterized protein n=1 Tax=Peribacillus faecalis TaxID=2772559 RepID=A0A927HAJ5_9BACI|nr:hypothetical protein [Peribacillus faecalis]MBD3107994.1 hypothetical protein [Peribacillus faecalis]
MMSFVQTTKSEIVKKQYLYKLKAYKGSYSSLMAVQIIGLLFSTTVSGSMGGSSSGDFSYEFDIYSTNMVFAFTLLWAFVTGMTITSKNYRYDDFSFVANRQTSNLSNMLFLLSISAVAGATAILIGFAYRLLFPLVISAEILSAPYTVTNLAVGIMATVLYCLLLSALGYLVGTISQLNKAFKFILPILLIGMLFANSEMISSMLQFYLMETSFLNFMFKVIIPTFIFFLLASVISNRMEVRK